MTRYKTAAKLLACIILAVATLRAVTFWAADPMLAYANNYDQIRTLRVFGLNPKDSPKALYEMTPERPYRYFVQSDTWHAPIYPSSDLLFKAIQFGTMAAFRASDGTMDIKIATVPALLGWLLGIWLIFRRMTARPLAALGFAGWVLLVADPINLLFLNTWYAEFSAFAMATLFVGVAWLWLFQLVSLRGALVWGAVCLAFLSLNRNQYMFLLLAVALLVGSAMVVSRPRKKPSLASAAKWVLIVAACLLPILAYNAAAKKRIYIETATNRTNTVFSMLLPASKNPTKMLEHMGLPPQGCLQFSGKNLYTKPEGEFMAHCPKILKLSLVGVAKAVVQEPATLVTIIRNIAQHHNGFLQHHIGHIEEADYAFIDNGSRSHFNGIEFRAGQSNAEIGSSQPYYLQSVDPLVNKVPVGVTVLLIWLVALGPALAALVAWLLKQRRWAFMFLLSGLLFNYALFSSILGDGYFELERHAVLCFSFGVLFFVLLASFAVSRFDHNPEFSG
ncbi:MAG: hypothetical protein ABS45_14370 [Comamonas sp. SCN 65-56]|uniref:hypothetical protein n=1 Tax=Comamonas sp. SCN 65-56 TaxID=1660095 RepID=UPI00086CF249|nr:hypothetical protein [Comamonas sp. SCN 65-56]ODS90834.1 MAG: hypothetical protein ABS45_14370 [Comamonas sp. SCN 65-56]